MEQELIVKWKIKESETSRIVNLLPQLVEKARSEEGNLLYNIYQSVHNANELVLHERYDSAEALEAHKNSGHYLHTVQDQIIPHLEMREVSLLKKLF